MLYETTSVGETGIYISEWGRKVDNFLCKNFSPRQTDTYVETFLNLCTILFSCHKLQLERFCFSFRNWPSSIPKL